MKAIMRSLIQDVEILRVIRKALLLAVSLFCIPALAGTVATRVASGTFLEEPRIVAANGNGEIHIAFSDEVRYIRHFPEKRGDTLRIFFEITDPCAAEEIVAQESKWLPPADWHMPVTVTFPELIGRAGSGTAVCPATRSRVDVAKTLLVKFGKVTNFKVRMGDDHRSIVVTVPLLKQPEEARIKPSASPVATVEPIAAKSPEATALADTTAPIPELTAAPVDLLTAGRAALAAGDAIKATQIFNELLRRPPNEYSQEAQELIGVAREKSGEAVKAKAEYELYLKLYPGGDGATRVKQRLAALVAAKPESKEVLPKAKPKKGVKEIHQNTVTGSVSQYYYGGSSQTRSDNYRLDEETKTRSNDQSSLITNMDMTARFRHNQYDTKVVFRDTQSHNFFGDLYDKNTVSAAYVEHTNKEIDYMVRLGRQSGTSQGVLGRFDGAFGRYGINPQWHVTAVVGRPDDGSHNKIQTSRHFYGAAVEFGPLAEKWSGSVYGIRQVADDLVERRAIGSELRYFNGSTSWFGMVDYDTIYDMVNIAMIQGNWVAFDGYNFNLLLDHRKSPILYAETAIQAKTGALSVGDLRSTLSNSTIYKYVPGLVPDSDMAMIGVTKQVTERWQLGGDIRYNETYNTDGAGDVAGQPGSGKIWTYTVQAIGTNTLFKDDTSVIMASFVNDPTYNAQNLSYSNSLTLHEKWRLDSSLRYYHENSNTDTTTWKMTPTLRVNYHFRDNMSFEAEASAEYTRTHDPVSTTNTDMWRETLFAGYRWDFR